MAAFIFLGAPPNVTETVAFGVGFRVGEPVEITDAHAVRKLRGNAHFLEMEAATPAPVVGTENAILPVVKRRGRPPRI